MKTITKFITIGLSAAFVAMATTPLCHAQDQAAQKPERIGIYDSRSIAVAYAGSPVHEQQLQKMKEEHRKAKEAGDADKAAKLEAEGRAQQKAIHKQGFSTAPVNDLLQNITNALPQIQKDAGVTTIISKWDEAELNKHPGAQKVDVTMQLVDAFHPSERQRKFAIDIQKHKPISIEQAEKIND